MAQGMVKMGTVIHNNPYGIDKKTLVTGGCSFSVDGCWPTQLAYGLDMEYMIAGQSGAGNEFIMTATLFNISNLLAEGKDPEDLLVGVMWSGADRITHHFIDAEENRLGDCAGAWGKISDESGDYITFAPSQVKQSRQDINTGKNRYADLGDFILNELYATDVQRVLHTLKSIFTLQEYLKRHEIQYFFMRYTEDAFLQWIFDRDDTPSSGLGWEHDDIKWWVKLIDWDKFIEGGMYQWCYDHADRPFVEEKKFGWEPTRNSPQHPSHPQHQQYTEQVIIPYLKENGYV